MRKLIRLSLPALAALLLLAACGSSSPSKTASASASVKPVAQTSGAATLVRTASIASLGTALVNSQGMTLYRLSGEQNGKFICTSSQCLSVWHPLVAPTSATPSGSGVGSLGTVKRSDGTLQVTYKGAPLYTFAQDKQSGEANGQGIKDVGTWSVVTTSSGAAAPAAASASESSSGSGSSAGSESSSGSGSSGGGYAY